ncbi:23892_t:CDS:2 [Gigaspora margarita]|uniref:23892_t:CDS:1 n=1 Tax=Gigaspora margarita TaxID=4874 RepID=A0ABN7UPY6_GIGMA|nr:23892_t:CDS:2 [Gigaspora margarita]
MKFTLLIYRLVLMINILQKISSKYDITKTCDNYRISYSEKYIQTFVDLITEQAYNTKIHDAKILQRMDIFFVKLDQSEAIKSLLTDYLDTESIAVWEWNFQFPFVDGYRRDSRYFKVMDSFEEFK